MHEIRVGTVGSNLLTCLGRYTYTLLWYDATLFPMSHPGQGRAGGVFNFGKVKYRSVLRQHAYMPCVERHRHTGTGTGTGTGSRRRRRRRERDQSGYIGI